MALRTMPNNIEAEKSVLGACFLSKYALEKACDNLSQEKFFDEKNGKIFAAISKMHEEKTPLDLTTLTTELQNRNTLHEIRGVEYLPENLNIVTTDTNNEYNKNNIQQSTLIRN